MSLIMSETNATFHQKITSKSNHARFLHLTCHLCLSNVVSKHSSLAPIETTKDPTSHRTSPWFLCSWDSSQFHVNPLKKMNSRWWFRIFFHFYPLPGKMIQFDEYFSNGLVQPPTRIWFSHTHTHTPQTNRFNPPRSSRNSLIIFRAYENHCLPWLNPWDLTLGTPWDFRMPKFPRMTWKKHESGPCFQWSFFGTVRDFFFSHQEFPFETIFVKKVLIST